MPDAPRITHVYSYCTDLAAMRAFYEGLLALPVKDHNDSFIGFDVGVRLVFLKTNTAGPHATTFSSFPGWQGGMAEQALCSIHCTKPELDALRDRLFAAGSDFTEMELRDGAWELRALDPMGNTVELYALDAG
jgi:catechol 2,3-dioxygenase-like lactoylglutathione lyase family enzyme